MPGESAQDSIVAITGLRFGWHGSENRVLDIETLQINRGERVFIEGPSGSGKSTLLSLMAGVVTPQQGCVTILDQRIDNLSGAQRDRFRADHIGFIFQLFNLISYLSVLENVTLPCRFSKQRQAKAQKRSANPEAEAQRLLIQLDMAAPDLLQRPVSDLSVGQQQRVAAARALIGSPEILIADEPTSSLDTHHREGFIHLLFEECRREDITLVFVSHDTRLAALFDRTIRLEEINRAREMKIED